MNRNIVFDLLVNIFAGILILFPCIMLIMSIIEGKFIAAIVFILSIFAIIWFILWFNGVSFFKKSK